MGRPVKMTEEKLLKIIEGWPNKTAVALGVELGVDHTTILRYVQKLKDRGVPMEKSPEFEQRDSDQLVDSLLKKNPHYISG